MLSSPLGAAWSMAGLAYSLQRKTAPHMYDRMCVGLKCWQEERFAR